MTTINIVHSLRCYKSYDPFGHTRNGNSVLYVISSESHATTRGSYLQHEGRGRCAGKRTAVLAMDFHACQRTPRPPSLRHVCLDLLVF